jgi:hypothetical protein
MICIARTVATLLRTASGWDVRLAGPPPLRHRKSIKPLLRKPSNGFCATLVLQGGTREGAPRCSTRDLPGGSSALVRAVQVVFSSLPSLAVSESTTNSSADLIERLRCSKHQDTGKGWAAQMRCTLPTVGSPGHPAKLADFRKLTLWLHQPEVSTKSS